MPSQPNATAALQFGEVLNPIVTLVKNYFYVNS